MKIHTFSWHPYEIPLTNGLLRRGILLYVVDLQGNCGWGEVAPLPKWSQETFEEALHQIKHKQREIEEIEWTLENCIQEIRKLKLLPSATFGLESAFLSMLDPLPPHHVAVSAFLMGSPQEIMQEANLRYHEGYTSAKLKVSNLSFDDAAQLIHQLKDKFRLRIDVNRAWSTQNSLHFFKQFPLDAFDYVEEPFTNPHDLALFKHPLAVDESFPTDLGFKELESLKTLKALIFKPTIQGGMSGCLPLCEWATKRNVEIILSSSFESDIGLAHIAGMAQRLSLRAPVGIGTFNLLAEHVCGDGVRFRGGFVEVARPRF
jgi:O-succinylbenzoate synthase